MDDKQADETLSEQGDPTFAIDYIKSHQFRVVFAEGFLSSLTAGQKIHVAFWNSREPIPQRIEYRLNPDGSVEEHRRVVRADQIREVDVGVLMDLDTARALRDFLDEAITEAQESLDEAIKDDGSDGAAEVISTEQRIDEKADERA